MRTTNSSTGRTARFLMLETERMKKETQSKFGVTTEAKPRNGTLFISTNQMPLQLKDSAKTLALKSTSHSTSYLNFH
jgi:hypothetical protein